MHKGGLQKHDNIFEQHAEAAHVREGEPRKALDGAEGRHTHQVELKNPRAKVDV